MSAPTVRVGPGYAGSCEISLLGPSPGDRAHAFGLVVLGISDPSHAVTRLFAGDPADFSKQALLVGGAQEGLVAVADRSQFAIQTTQLLLCRTNLAEDPFRQQPQQHRGHRDKEPALVGLQPFDQMEVGHKVEQKSVRHENPQCPEEGVNHCKSQGRTQKSCLPSQHVATLTKIGLDAPPNRAEPGHERSERSKDDETRDLGPVDVGGADGLHEVPVEGDCGEEHRQHRRSSPSVPGTYGHRKQQ